MSSADPWKLKSRFVLRKIKKARFLVPLDTHPANVIMLNTTGVAFYETILKAKTKLEAILTLSTKFGISQAKTKEEIQVFLDQINKKTILSEKSTIEQKIPDDKYFGKDNIPISGSFELTGKCNLLCFHCYAKGEREKSPLGFKQIKNIIDQLVRSGCLFLQITGGESTVHQDFVEIYEYIKKAGIIPTISTNGTLITPQILKSFTKYPPRHVFISLYGSSPKTHEWVTRVKGSFIKATTNAKRLKNAGLSVSFNSVIFEETYKDVKKIRAFTDEIGIPVRFTGNLIPTLQSDSTALNKKINSYLDKKAYLLSFNSQVPDYLSSHTTSEIKNNKVFPCNAGTGSFHIDCLGNLYPCKIEREVSYSILKLGFKKAWKNINDLSGSYLKLPDKCISCGKLIECDICPLQARLFEKSGVKINCTL